jgi:hypothetical protein
MCAKRKCAKFDKADEQALKNRKDWASKKGFMID